jgi:hypothetical protein
MLLIVGVAPCDKCGRELITDEATRPGEWYFPAGCADIHGDGCNGHADTDKAHPEIIDIH